MYYAKSEPIETIKEHTDKLLENLRIIRNVYGDKIVQAIDMDVDRFWQLMEIVCTYHDVGKVFSGFQNQILKKTGKKLVPTIFRGDIIKHEQISPAFIPSKFFDLNDDEKMLVYQSIFYHHERDIVHVDRDLLKEIIEDDIKPNLESIKNELGIQVGELKTFYLRLVEGQARITEESGLYNDYCLMKGLLHRLDHCSSAHVTIEDDTTKKIGEFVEEFMENKDFKLNDLQVYSKENKDNNLIVIGSTGMGKTEASLLWSSGDKAFFTLPLRISINAIFDRIRDSIGYSHVGLLHSTAFDYLEQKNEEEKYLSNLELSRNLSQKLTTCTIDQIFPFVFKYRGYEKIYAILSYSKIIIDEIQAYSPEIVAVILKGLQMINSLNGKFMIMTATLPRIYKEKLEEMGINFEYSEFIKPVQRHKIMLLDEEINFSVEEIFKESKDKKVLVIVNTINKAIELYREFEKFEVQNVNLLHSRFIQDDRDEKERRIKEFSNSKNESGIWITTQIVEASLDIDFDMLYTEMSTLDSLFQRLGRCYRGRTYTGDECNVKIYTKKCSGIKCVYDEEIHKKSIELLKPYDKQVLEEKVKIDLVDRLYSKELIGNTKFYRDFQDAFMFLDNIIDYDSSKKDAEKLLRNIDNYCVIPRCIYDDNLDLFKEYEANKSEKFNLRREINKKFISISKGNYWRLQERITDCPYVKGMYIIDCRYDKDIGLLLEDDEEYDLNSREF